jgi:glycosyltransferase involved in cell wall biosynthesis
MKEERVDVVNAQRPSSHTLGLIAARLARVPVFVATRRVSVPVNFLSAKLKYSLVDRIISVSDAVKDVLVGCGVQPHKVVTVYSGIDLSRFNPDKIGGSHIRKEFGISLDTPLIGMIGNIGKLKGQREFVRAARLVIKEVSEARFILVGSGTNKAFIEGIDRDMLPYFICAGFRRDIPEILAALDVHVNSSIGFDGLAGTIREGLAMRRPTVATDVAGHKEIIRDMETGLLVHPGDYKALASAIVRLVKEKELAASLAEKGREFVELNMAEETMVERTEAVYLDVLCEKDFS